MADTLAAHNAHRHSQFCTTRHMTRFPDCDSVEYRAMYNEWRRKFATGCRVVFNTRADRDHSRNVGRGWMRNGGFCVELERSRHSQHSMHPRFQPTISMQPRAVRYEAVFLEQMGWKNLGGVPGDLDRCSVRYTFKESQDITAALAAQTDARSMSPS